MAKKRTCHKKKQYVKKMIPSNEIEKWESIVSKRYCNRHDLMLNYKKIINNERKSISGDLSQFWTYHDNYVEKLDSLMAFVGELIASHHKNATGKHLFKIFPQIDHKFTFIQSRINGDNPKLQNLDYPVITFHGQHFNCKLPGKSNFDPYHEYQNTGSHQFCQTYSLMKLVDKLPKVVEHHKDSDYHHFYEYSIHALKFIQGIIKTCISKRVKIYSENNDEFFQDLLTYVNEILEIPEISFNVVVQKV